MSVVGRMVRLGRWWELKPRCLRNRWGVNHSVCVDQLDLDERPDRGRLLRPRCGRSTRTVVLRRGRNVGSKSPHLDAGLVRVDNGLGRARGSLRMGRPTDHPSPKPIDLILRGRTPRDRPASRRSSLPICLPIQRPCTGHYAVLRRNTRRYDDLVRQQLGGTGKQVMDVVEPSLKVEARVRIPLGLQRISAGRERYSDNSRMCADEILAL